MKITTRALHIIYKSIIYLRISDFQIWLHTYISGECGGCGDVGRVLVIHRLSRLAWHDDGHLLNLGSCFLSNFIQIRW